MRSLVKWIAVLVAVILLGLLVNEMWQRHKGKQDAVIDSKIQVAHQQDSSTMHHIDSVSVRIDTVTRTAVQYIERWHTLTEKVLVPGRVDSIYRDTLFAKLPDSSKVKVLVADGNKNADVCSALVVTCRQFRDSAYAAFTIKDREIQLWHDRFDHKPRRSCGLGVTLGIIGGLGATGSPISGVGGAAGYSCNF